MKKELLMKELFQTYLRRISSYRTLLQVFRIAGFSIGLVSIYLLTSIIRPSFGNTEGKVIQMDQMIADRTKSAKKGLMYQRKQLKKYDILINNRDSYQRRFMVYLFSGDPHRAKFYLDKYQDNPFIDQNKVNFMNFLYHFVLSHWRESKPWLDKTMATGLRDETRKCHFQFYVDYFSPVFYEQKNEIYQQWLYCQLNSTPDLGTSDYFSELYLSHEHKGESLSLREFFFFVAANKESLENWLLAILYAQKESEIRPYLKDIPEERRKDTRIAELLAIIWFNLGDQKNLAPYLETASNTLHGQLIKANLALQKKDVQTAFEHLSNAQKFYPLSANVMERKFLTSWQLKKYQEGEKHLKDWGELQRVAPPLFFILEAAFALQNKEFGEAKNALAKFRENFNGIKLPLFYFQIGRILYYLEGDFERARKSAYETCLKNDQWGCWHLGHYLADRLYPAPIEKKSKEDIQALMQYKRSPVEEYVQQSEIQRFDREQAELQKK